MQRFVLALLLAALVAAAGATVWARLRESLGTGGTDLPAPRRDGVVQKTAFGLLMGVMLYIGFSGGG